MICFYHSADLDGKCSAAIVKKAYPDIRLYGINYGEKFPWDEIEDDEPVIMVDFSLQPFDEMVRLSNKHSLTWIDHHKTAIRDSQSEKYSKFSAHSILDTSKAACELAFEYFFPGKELPPAVKYLSQYDTWNFSQDGSDRVLPFQMGMRIYNGMYPTDPTWSAVLNGNNGFIEETIKMGVVVLKYQENTNSGYVKSYSIPTEIDGIPALAVCGGMTNSQVFKCVDKKIGGWCRFCK